MDKYNNKDFILAALSYTSNLLRTNFELLGYYAAKNEKAINSIDELIITIREDVKKTEEGPKKKTNPLNWHLEPRKEEMEAAVNSYLQFAEKKGLQVNEEGETIINGCRFTTIAQIAAKYGFSYSFISHKIRNCKLMFVRVAIYSLYSVAETDKIFNNG